MVPYLGRDLTRYCLSYVCPGEVVFLYRIVRYNRGLFRSYYDLFKREIPHILSISTPCSRFHRLVPSIYETFPFTLLEMVELEVVDLPNKDLSAACCSKCDHTARFLALVYVKKILLPMTRKYHNKGVYS
jgi:hypothetical protein